MPRKTVITAYNIRSYQIDGLDWEKNPTTYFFTVKKDGKEREISMKDYLKQQYDVNLRDLKQPLLYVNFRDTRIYLPTEMCREASLPENFTSDSRKMRDLQEHKISHPEQRFKRIIDVINKLMIAEEFKQFEVEMKANEHQVVGKVLYPP